MSRKNRRQGFNPDGEVNETVEGEDMNENSMEEQAVEAVAEEVAAEEEAKEEVSESVEAVAEEAKEEVAAPAVEEKKEYVTPVVEEAKAAPVVKEEPKKEEAKEEVSGELQVGDTVIIVPTVEKDLTGIRFGGTAYAAKYTVDRFQGKNNEKVVIKSKVSRFTLLVGDVRKVQ